MYCDLVDFDNKIIGHFKEKKIHNIYYFTPDI